MSPPRSGRDDQTEVVAIVRPLDGFLPGIDPLSGGVIEDPMLAVGAGAFSPQVRHMACQTAPGFARFVPADVGLDHHCAGAFRGSNPRRGMFRACPLNPRSRRASSLLTLRSRGRRALIRPI